MYGYINGVVKMIKPTHIVLENNGIGYLIIVPNPYRYKLEENTKVYIHHYVREDINNLYGFVSEEAKDLFIKLISVSGVGPKTGLSIMATDNIDGVIVAIENNDSKYLAKFPGIGNKTAQQIILDLRGKLVVEEQIVRFGAMEDAKKALLALGYSSKEITKVLKNIDHDLTVEEIIKEALKKIFN